MACVPNLNVLEINEPYIKPMKPQEGISFEAQEPAKNAYKGKRDAVKRLKQAKAFKRLGPPKERQKLIHLEESLKTGKEVKIEPKKQNPASEETKLKVAISKFKNSPRTNPPVAGYKGLISQKFPCGKCIMQKVCPYFDPGGVCVYEIERYKHYIMRYKDKTPTESLLDFTARTEALLDFMKMRAQNSSTTSLYYPITKMVETVSNNLDRIHKHLEGEKLVLESKLTEDLDRITERVGIELRKKRADEMRNNSVDAEFVPDDSFQKTEV